jgi:hypothetical protein
MRNFALGYAWVTATVRYQCRKDSSVGTLAMNWNVTLSVLKKGGVSVWEDAVWFEEEGATGGCLGKSP